MSLILLTITAFAAYITATYVIEVISISSAIRSRDRAGTIFPEETYKTKE
jgi:hypothetical protein